MRFSYIEEQDGKCHHCNNPLDGEPTKEIMRKPISTRLFPVGFFSRPVHLHHNHNTGMTIGTVHARCNAVLWQYHGE